LTPILSADSAPASRAQGAKPEASKPQATSKPAQPSASKKPDKPSKPKPPQGAVPANQLGLVDGIPIYQEEWDRLSKPYFEEVEARAGRAVTEEEKRLLMRNVLDELIRERLWVADARRRGMTPSEQAVDARMKQSAYFKTGGKVDEGKFLAFKRSPTSNYPTLRAQVERSLELEEYVRWMERRFGPRESDLKKTFEEQTTQGQIRYAVLGPDLISLEPEATAEQIRAYYDAHPDEFETPDEAHIQYIRVRAPEEAATDSLKEVAAAAAREASGVLAAVKAGTPPETAGKPHGGVLDSGWFRMGDPVRGLGRSDALDQAVRNTAAGEWAAEPVRVGPYLVVMRVAERKSSRRQPFYEAVASAKRKADGAVREAWLDSLARGEMAAHPERYAAPRVEATIVARALSSFAPGPTPSAKEVSKAVDKNRKAAGIPKSNRAWIDSATAATPMRLAEEKRMEGADKTMRSAIKALQGGSGGAAVARAVGGTSATFDRYRSEPPRDPLLVEGALMDTLYTLRPGAIVGPRVNRDSIFVVRVDRLDPVYRPPFEAVRDEARDAALDSRRLTIEREAEAWFQERRSEYSTPVKWILDYVRFPKPNPGTLGIPEDSISAYWKGHPLEFTVPGRVRVRHILAATKGSEVAAVREAARQKALAARKRVLAGEDFAAVARDVSDDPGSASRGGDLGELTRGTILKEFGDVAFTLPVGETSEPFETKLGFHVIQVLDRADGRLRPLDDCRAEIQEVLGASLAESLAHSAAVGLIKAASRSGGVFDSIAVEKGGARRTPPLSASDELEGVGRIPDLARLAGGIDDGAVADEPVPYKDGFIVLRRVREIPPEPAPFAQVRDRVISDYSTVKRRAVADSLDQRFRAAVKAGQDLDGLFIPLGGLRTSRQFGRSGPIPDLSRDPALARDSTFLATVFGSKPGTVLPPREGRVGTLYAKVDTVIVLPPSEFAKRRDTLLRELIDERIEAWTARLRSKAPIRMHRRDLQSLLASNAVAPTRDRP
jgi:parvulin-like peptidyl-prolyl isomerase